MVCAIVNNKSSYPTSIQREFYSVVLIYKQFQFTCIILSVRIHTIVYTVKLLHVVQHLGKVYGQIWRCASGRHEIRPFVGVTQGKRLR